MIPYRSLLFVPGQKGSWVDKGLAAGADALILDLEDAVPEDGKEDARRVTAQSVDRLAATSPAIGVVVRVNALDTAHFGRDLEAVVRPGLTAVLIPKVNSTDDLIAFDALLRHFEIAAGLAVGAIEVIPSFETAASLVNAATIAAGPRVGSLMAAAAKDADISREVGFHWTAEGLETLYLRSRAILAGRAAGLRHMVLGLWQEIRDLDGLRTFAEANRRLGFGGQVVIHPSHVPVVNDVYGLTDQEVERYRALVAAYDDGAAAGNGAVMFDGEHIDLAHAKNARDILTHHERRQLAAPTTEGNPQ